VNQLLTSLFVDPKEARRFFSTWLQGRPGVDLDAIAWNECHAEVMFELARHLEAAGLVDDDLFDALAELKPRRAPEIVLFGRISKASVGAEMQFDHQPGPAVEDPNW